jgi:hypothetical protein
MSLLLFLLLSLNFFCVLVLLLVCVLVIVTVDDHDTLLTAWEAMQFGKPPQMH